MTIIPVYDSNGDTAYTIAIDDTVEQVGVDRVLKGNNCYYKGLGVKYNGHMLHLDSINQNDYIVKDKSNIFYAGHFVEKKAFIGKFGIFQEYYSPFHTDFIGTCGNRELSIIENSNEFERSSLELIKSIQHDKVNSQYYFIVNYKCNRVKYLHRGNPSDLVDLIHYLISEDWNFVWDKNTISDISYNGLVTDLADVFKSRDKKEKVGSIYSILYSLYKADKFKYSELISAFGIVQKSVVFDLVAILEACGVDVSDLLLYDNKEDNYRNIVLNYIIQGKNCGHCVVEDLGDKIRNQYIEDITKRLGG